MFSYRHAFHAGNHADVLKHAILVHVLDYFNRKDSAYWVVDTHAGAGLYALDDRQNGQDAEWRDGIGRLWQRTDTPPLVAAYLAQVASHNTGCGHGSILRAYPGSPWLALNALRPGDRLRLFELHPSESTVLAANLARLAPARQRQIALYDADGFTGVKALLPPPTRRGLILIDPSYEDKRNYRHVLETLRAGLRRFANGCYVVWYPHAQRRDAAELPRQLTRLPIKDWLHASLTVRRPDASGHGLHASGMFLVNPPWTLATALRDALPWLARALAQDGYANFTLDAGPGA